MTYIRSIRTTMNILIRVDVCLPQRQSFTQVSKSIRMIRTTDVVIHVLYRLLNVCGLHTSSTFNYLTVGYNSANI